MKRDNVPNSCSISPDLLWKPLCIFMCSEQSGTQYDLRVALWESGMPNYAISSPQTLAEAIGKKGVPDLVIIEHGVASTELMRSILELRSRSMVPILTLLKVADLQHYHGSSGMYGDDFVVLPCEQSELVLRACILCREDFYRETSLHSNGVLRSSQRTVHLNGKTRFSEIEQQILRTLHESLGRVVPHELLILGLPGDDFEEKRASLRVWIYRLRRKIEPNPHVPIYIVSHARIGYELTRPICVSS